MKNIEQIIKRYEKQIPPYSVSVMGFLHWGGKGFYRVNSNKRIQLNSTPDGFITSPTGQVQQYSIDKNFNSRCWWGQTLDKYYPWPYFPKKKIKAFEVVRIMPGHRLGEIIKVENKLDTKLKLNYPEFFKPIY